MKPFSPISHGYWRLMDWNLSPQDIASLVEATLDLGIYTIDHADIYGDYRCEASFGQGFGLLAPSVRQKVQLVSKCGIKLPEGDKGRRLVTKSVACRSRSVWRSRLRCPSHSV